MCIRDSWRIQRLDRRNLKTFMKIGIGIRAMGPQSKPNIISSVLRSAENVGLESAWVVDHIAIPPDDAEGSGGRYLDPLTTLSWMAGQTRDIMLGTGVLILPYRSRLPLAKAIASLQELSSGRFISVSYTHLTLPTKRIV